MSDTKNATVDKAMAGAMTKIPPHSLADEAAVLGSMILSPEAISEVIPLLGRGDAFYFEKNRAVYRAIVDEWDEQANVDIVALQSRIKRMKLETEIPVNYLIQLGESVPDPTSARYYAERVVREAKSRALIDACGKAIRRAMDNDDGDTVLDTLERDLFDLRASTRRNEPTQMGELMQDTLAHLEATDGRSMVGLSTGFHELDDLLCGLQPGQMVVAAGRPGLGKSAFATDIARHVACVEKRGVLYVSLEMSRDQLGLRLMAAQGEVEVGAMRANMLREDEWERLHIAVGDLSESPLLIDDTPDFTLMELRAAARRQKLKHNIELLVVDYLQLMRGQGNRRENRQTEVADLSRGIKQLARELEIPVLLLAQLNREVESRADNRPKLSDLRESGAIEQDADVVLLLHREDYYHGHDSDWRMNNQGKIGVADCIVAKQRMGATGTIKLRFEGALCRFSSLGQHGG